MKSPAIRRAVAGSGAARGHANRRAGTAAARPRRRRRAARRRAARGTTPTTLHWAGVRLGCGVPWPALLGAHNDPSTYETAKVGDEMAASKSYLLSVNNCVYHTLTYASVIQPKIVVIYQHI